MAITTPITTIDAGANVATLINQFTVRPQQQREFVDMLIHATEELIQHQPGYVAANIHASKDGTRVVNYAQWESAESWQSMLADPDCRKHLSAVAGVAEADPHIYTVERVHHR